MEHSFSIYRGHNLQLAQKRKNYLVICDGKESYSNFFLENELYVAITFLASLYGVVMLVDYFTYFVSGVVVWTDWE
jgi:hypothetical protein